jgi:hypothetical protein
MGGTGRSIALGLALAAALTAAPRDSRAADPDKRSYELGLYVWGNSLVSTIDTDEGSATSRIPFSDLLDNLNVAAMLRARANFDKLSIVFDGEYFDLESETHRQTIRLGPQGNLEVEASAKVKLVQYILELNAGYQIFDLDAPYSLVRGDELRTRGELYAGARYLSMKPEIEIQVGAQRADIGNWESWVDGVVGARLAFDLSENVALGIQGDVGGFDVGQSSKLTWMQITSLSWRYSDSMTLALGYKFLDVKREVGDNTIELQLRGPFIATFVRF